MISKIRVSQLLALFFYFSLAATVVYWVSTLDPSTNRLAPFLLATVPLLPLVRGMLHGRPKTYALAALVSLLYLLHSSMEIWHDGNCLAIPEIICAAGLLISASFYARWASMAAANENK